ncbi:formyltransferase family protein [Chromobacterium vaccinii]|uniref:Formyltransferase family protein n=1 Tax=Chromobacterium vaccinii TaxID=1108595 RepID=A0ABV0FAW7_9NEIS
MRKCIRVVLFSEVNSKLGAPFLSILWAHPQVKLLALVTSQPGRSCTYFHEDKEQVDLERQAQVLGVPVLRPHKVNETHVVDQLKKLNADFFIVGNFQQKLGRELLDIPKVMAINFHPSPLPRYAGLAPFYWMSRNGETKGGVSAIKMDEGLDTGPIILQRDMPLSGFETAIELRGSQENENVFMLWELVPKMLSGDLECKSQYFEQRTYFGRPSDDDYCLDFTQSSKQVIQCVRAGYRYPGAYIIIDGAKRLTILSASQMRKEALGVQHMPNLIRKIENEVYVAAADGWVKIDTIEENGQQVALVDAWTEIQDQSFAGREWLPHDVEVEA